MSLNKFNEMFEIIGNMQLGEIKDELDLLKGRDGVEENLIRELLKYELHKRAQRTAPDYKHHLILLNKNGKYEICDKEYGMPVEIHDNYETAVKRKRALNMEYRENQRI